MISVPTWDNEYYSSSDCSKLGHYTGSYKSNQGPVPTGKFFSFQFHCFRIIRKNMMSSVENFLNRSYPRFASITATQLPPLSGFAAVLCLNVCAVLLFVFWLCLLFI